MKENIGIEFKLKQKILYFLCENIKMLTKIFIHFFALFTYVFFIKN